MSKELWRPVDERMAKLANKIHNYAVAIVDRDNIIAWTKLRRGIDTKYHPERKAIDVYVKQDIAPHAQYVHEGRKAGKMPPVGPIEAWLRKKKIPPRNKELAERLKNVRLTVHIKDRALLSKRQRELADHYHTTAWKIAKKMQKEGLKPRRFLVEAIIKALKEYK